ncbi:hypothetical protein, partial [Flavobacterium filum]|uniref:hypothetical protein n=1 Tax=Flavobacterium filum TaxID=370974 RepID=UPI0023F16817
MKPLHSYVLRFVNGVAQNPFWRIYTLTALLLLLITGCQTLNNKTDLLRNKIEQIVSNKNAVVGVSIIGNNGK